VRGGKEGQYAGGGLIGVHKKREKKGGKEASSCEGKGGKKGSRKKEGGVPLLVKTENGIG